MTQTNTLPPPPRRDELPDDFYGARPVLRTSLMNLLGLLYGPDGDAPVNEIALNGADDLWVKRSGLGWSRANVPPGSFDRPWAEMLGIHVSSYYGRRFDPANWPVLSAPLPGGHRLQLVVGSPVRSGLAISIRRRRRQRFELGNFGLTDGAHLPADPQRQAGKFDSGYPVGTAADLLAVMRAGLPVLISGGTDSGKTSFLSSLLRQGVPAGRRVGTVEDVEEVDLAGFENSLGFLAEPASTGVQIGYGELIKAVLRVNLDVAIVGELQQDSAMPAFRLLNSGHEGWLGTIHADSPLDALEAWRTILAMSMGSASAASEALGVIARKVARIVQLSSGKRVVEIGRPADLDWRRLLRG